MQFSRLPYLVSFAGNAIRYGVTYNGSTGGGAQAQIKLAFSATDQTSGNQIRLSMLRSEIAYTLSPTETLYTLPVAVESDTAQTWAEKCYEYLQRKYDLIQNYDIALSQSDITLTAKQAGEDYNISVIEQTIVGITVSTVVEGTSPPSSGGVLNGFLLQVRDLAGKLLGEEYKPADKSNAAQFDVSEYLNAEVEVICASSLSLYLIGNNHFQQEPGHVLKYRVSVAPVIDNIVESFIQDIFRYAIAGGLSRQRRVENLSLSLDYWSDPNLRQGFLTLSPVTKITDAVCPERLYWFLQDQGSNVRLKIRYYTPEGYGDVEAFILNNRNPYNKFEILAGYAELKLSEISSQITSWKIWIEDDQGEVLSEQRMFFLDTRYTEYCRYFVFRNSLGHYDFVRFTGKFQQKLEHERDKVDVISEEDETVFNAPGTTSAVRERLKFKANSGWVSEEYLNFLRDFLLSKEIYEYDQGRYYRSVITSTKTVFKEDREHNYSLSFEYERGYEDVFFSTNQPTEENMLSLEDNHHGAGVILQVGEDVTYIGYPKPGTLSEDEASFRIKRITRSVNAGTEKHLIEWADGNTRFDNAFSDCQTLTYGFLTE